MKVEPKFRRRRRPHRPLGSGSDLTLVPLSCPDCAGVLSVTKEELGAQRLFMCQINHRHSMTSLYQAMEERLENTLWTAVVMMKQMDRVYRELLSKQQRPTDGPAKHIKRRLRELQAQRVALHALIMGTHVIESAK